MSILVVWNLVLPEMKAFSISFELEGLSLELFIPLIQSNGILHEQQCLIMQKRRPQSCGEVNLFQGHSSRSIRNSL